MVGHTIHTLVYDPVTARLDLPCAGAYGYRCNITGCSHPQDGHGHVVLSSDDGVALVRAPIYSRPFLVAVLQALEARGVLDHHEAAALKQTQAPLSREPLAPELALMLDPSLLAKATATSWASGG